MGKGDDVVEEVTFDQKSKTTGNLIINKTQYFQNIPVEVFNFQIGGYQVLFKYLKDRKGRKLKGNEQNAVEKIGAILHHTISQMQNIDEQTKSWI